MSISAEVIVVLGVTVSLVLGCATGVSGQAETPEEPESEAEATIGTMAATQA